MEKAWMIDEGVRFRERIIQDQDHMERLARRLAIDEASLQDYPRPLWKPEVPKKKVRIIKLFKSILP